jgi:hypothetical protein
MYASNYKRQLTKNINTYKSQSTEAERLLNEPEITDAQERTVATIRDKLKAAVPKLKTYYAKWKTEAKDMENADERKRAVQEFKAWDDSNDPLGIAADAQELIIRIDTAIAYRERAAERSLNLTIAGVASGSGNPQQASKTTSLRSRQVSEDKSERYRASHDRFQTSVTHSTPRPIVNPPSPPKGVEPDREHHSFVNHGVCVMAIIVPALFEERIEPLESAITEIREPAANPAEGNEASDQESLNSSDPPWVSKTSPCNHVKHPGKGSSNPRGPGPPIRRNFTRTPRRHTTPHSSDPSAQRIPSLFDIKAEPPPKPHLQARIRKARTVASTTLGNKSASTNLKWRERLPARIKQSPTPPSTDHGRNRSSNQWRSDADPPDNLPANSPIPHVARALSRSNVASSINNQLCKPQPLQHDHGKISMPAAETINTALSGSLIAWTHRSSMAEGSVPHVAGNTTAMLISACARHKDIQAY